MTSRPACLGLLLAILTTQFDRDCSAQGVDRAAVGSVATSRLADPTMNPYLNPALAVGTASRNDALLYLWAAQQQPGGLLAARPTGGERPKAAEMPRTAMRPGGGASRYFNRQAEAGPRSARGFGRSNRFFNSNGR